MDLQHKVREALKKAVDFLLHYYDQNGAFTSFSIEGPGISDEWVSAYVGQCLIGSGMPETKEIRKVVKRIAKFLKEKRHKDGGWGFNASCLSDCDSTANAVLFLTQVNETADKASLTCLKSFQRKDGGFSTYLGGTKPSWEISHAEVTACAALAFHAAQDTEGVDIEGFEKFLRNQFSIRPLAPSYWWNSEYYASLMILKCFRAYGFPFPDQTVRIETAMRMRDLPGTSFDTALGLELLNFLTRDNRKMEVYAKKLIKEQKNDGSFPGAGILRLPGSACIRPWEGQSCFPVEDNGVFTTAEAARALLSLLNDNGVPG